MARCRREWIDGAIYHLFARGSNRQAIFLNEGDYVEFEMLFADALRRHQLDAFGWSFMPNHWHGIVRSPPDGLSAFMKSVNHRYALRFDRRWGRRAHLFENRFGAVLQESEEQLLWTLRYVVRNPVEAGHCASPFDAKWTSFQPTAGLTPAPPHLCFGEVLALFGGTRAVASQRYVEFVTAGSSDPTPATDAAPALAIAV